MQKKHASAGVAMAVATLSMAAASGLQALLYLNSFGINGRTDGFFVAFALYTIVGVFSQSIRMTSANLLIGERPRLVPVEYATCLGLIAMPMLILTIPLASPFAHLLAPGLDAADRAVTANALPLLGIAAAMQLWSAGAATFLAVRDRFNAIAGAYIAGAAVGLLAYVVVSPLANELVLGWSMLAMATTTLIVMLLSLRGARPERVPTRPSFSPSRLVSMSGLILARTAIYLVFNALYMVTLAFASGYAEGDATVLSYAYLFASYLVAATAFALGLSRIADMRRGALGEWREVLADTVPSGFRYSMLVVAPAMAALVVAGAPLIGDLLPHSFDAADVETLRTFAALLAPWVVAALLVNLLLPALLALGRGRLVNAMAPGLLIVHVGATALGGALWGSDGVVGAAFVAPAAFAVVLFLVGTRDERRWPLARTLASEGGRLAAFAAASFAGGALISALVASGPAEAILAGVLGCALYVLCLRLAVPRLLQVMVSALRPKPGAQVEA
jgi:peptidoglycan biosynthesis protein MviN/MurJ (putative lipid II flippase)